MEQELQKGDVLFSTDGCRVYETNDGGLAMMEWEREEACELAFHLQRTLKRHALATNFRQRFGERTLVVRRLEPLSLTVLAQGAQHGARAAFVDAGGTALTREEAQRLLGGRRARLSVMEDAALHAVRTLRARLRPLGVDRLSLRLRFGLSNDGCCLLEVPNPLACDLGSADYEKLCAQLGGDRR